MDSHFWFWENFIFLSLFKLSISSLSFFFEWNLNFYLSRPFGLSTYWVTLFFLPRSPFRVFNLASLSSSSFWTFLSQLFAFSYTHVIHCQNSLLDSHMSLTWISHSLWELRFQIRPFFKVGHEHAPNHHTFFPDFWYTCTSFVGSFSNEHWVWLLLRMKFEYAHIWFFPPLGLSYLLYVHEKEANCIGSNGLAMD